MSAYINFCLRLILLFGLIFDLPVLFNMIRHDLMHSEIYSLSDYRNYRRTFFEIARGNGLLLKQIIETFDKKYVDYYTEHLIVKRIDKRFEEQDKGIDKKFELQKNEFKD